MEFPIFSGYYLHKICVAYIIFEAEFACDCLRKQSKSNMQDAFFVVLIAFSKIPELFSIKEASSPGEILVQTITSFYFFCNKM